MIKNLIKVLLINSKKGSNIGFIRERLPVSQKHWAPASWALTGCGWSGLCASSLWSAQQEEQRDSQGRPKMTGLKRLRSKAIIHSPLFSSFGPESARRCQETWTRWLGCTMRQIERKREMGGMALAQRKTWWLWFSCILLLLPSLIWHRGRMAHQLPSI